MVVNELSCPSAVASICSGPLPLIAPAGTESPGPTSTGIDSPVIRPAVSVREEGTAGPAAPLANVGRPLVQIFVADDGLRTQAAARHVDQALEQPGESTHLRRWERISATPRVSDLDPHRVVVGSPDVGVARGGLARRFVRPLGGFDAYETGTGFRIAPIVALVEPDFELSLDPREVAEVFETPLAFLMDPANHERREGVWRGKTRAYYAMPHDGRLIWGATAGMIRALWERLYE